MWCVVTCFLFRVSINALSITFLNVVALCAALFIENGALSGWLIPLKAHALGERNQDNLSWNTSEMGIHTA